MLDLIDANVPLFIVASLALIATPGQDNIYIVTRGIAQGRRAALVSAWGVCCGLLVHTALAALGLSALLAQSAVAFAVIKYAGAVYLIYLGARMLLSRKGFVAFPREGIPVTGLWKVFMQGVASNVLNPKTVLFFLAYLPQFVGPAPGSTVAQFLMLGLIFVALALIATTLIAYFSGSLGDWLKGKPRLASTLTWLTGGVLMSLGIRLAFTDPS